MSKKNHHLRMMGSKRLRHICHNRLDIWVTRTSFLITDKFLSQIRRKKSTQTHLNANPVGSLLLPRSMHDFDFNKAPDVFIEIRHQEVDVKEIIELPAFAYHWIPEDIPQSHGVDIVGCGKISDMRELNRRGDNLRLVSRGSRTI